MTADTTRQVAPTPLKRARPQWSARSAEDPTGRYLMIEELGRGGMGIVVKAYDATLQREVALKWVGPDALDDEAQARMVREARAMAKLSHGNVVSVFDVDTRDDGAVVVVMEYVRGSTLRQWLERRERSWREVVDAFVAAGRGLAAAHAQGILHRDFKPTNVLVSADRQIKVTDFGLAKGVGEADGRQSAATSGLDDLTEARTVMGTPRYMAPEQDEGKTLGPAADQYALCVALWEGLTGKAPFAGRDLGEQKRQGPPAWPQSSPVPSRVVAAIRRGLAVEPDQRWPSMDALLNALSEDSRGRRRRAAMTVGAVVVVGMGAFFVAGGAETSRCSGAQEQLSDAWNDTLRSQVQTAFGRTGLVYAPSTWDRIGPKLDAYASQWAAQHVEACEATTMRGEQSVAELDLRMTCLRRARIELTEAARILSEANPQTVERADAVVDGLPDLQRCADMEALRSSVPPPDPSIAESVAQMRAELARAEVASRARQHELTVPQLEELQQTAKSLGYSPLETEATRQLAVALRDAGRYDEAEDAYRVALRSALENEQWVQARKSAHNLVLLVGDFKAEPERALSYAGIAHSLLARVPSIESEATLHDAVGNVLRIQAKYVESEAEHRKALEVWTREEEPDLDGMAHSRMGLAMAFRSQGKYAEAEAELRTVLKVLEGTVGTEHPRYAIVLVNLGNVLHASGQYAKAEVETRRALRIMEPNLGTKHPNVALVRNNLGLMLLGQGKYEDAENELRRSLSTKEEVLGVDHADSARARLNLGLALRAQGRVAEAEVEFRVAKERWERSLGPEHPDVAEARTEIAGALFDQGKDVEAEREFRVVLRMRERELPPEHPEIADGRHNLARVLFESHRSLDEARELAEAAWRIRGQEDIPPALRAATAFLLARLIAPDDPARARSLATEARNAYAQAGAHRQPKLREVEIWLARQPAD